MSKSIRGNLNTYVYNNLYLISNNNKIQRLATILSYGSQTNKNFRF